MKRLRGEVADIASLGRGWKPTFFSLFRLVCGLDRMGVAGARANSSITLRAGYARGEGRLLQAVEVLIAYQDVGLWTRAAATDAAPSKAVC